MIDVDNRPHIGKALYNLIFSTRSFAVSRFEDKGYREALCILLERKRFDFVQFEGLSLAHYLEEVRKQHKGRSSCVPTMWSSESGSDLQRMRKMP